MFNSLVVRVSQNSNYLSWFEKQGMPDKVVNVPLTHVNNINALNEPPKNLKVASQNSESELATIQD
jgi:hypothetical protein